MLELLIVLCLVVINGVFSLSELAIVSARKTRLKTLAEAGRPGAKAALSLAEDPGKFLSTVQIGITLVGILAGAFSGAALGGRLTEILVSHGISPWIADPLGYGIVIVFITYLSVVIGELVPKHLALRNAEGLACAVAPLMAGVSRAAAPAVWLLDASTKLVFRVLGQGAEPSNTVTEQDIKTVIAEAESAGAIEGDEKQMIAGVLRLGDRLVGGLMTPRMEVDWLDLSDDEEVLRSSLIQTPHSRLPVAEGGIDNMLGVVQARELLAAALAGEPLNIRSRLRNAPIVPDTLNALAVLDTLRKAEVPMVLVHDEYGLFEGLVTPADILEAIAGAFRADVYEPEPDAVRREDGSWLLAGSMPIEEMADKLGIALPENRNYHTVAGLVLTELRHLPHTGEAVEAFGWRFEVIDLDGRRIDKVLASRA
ncbi:MAG: magnesium and cobalt exporter, family [Rhodospirillaceae bacterium]|nr:magnesium and cobalt exporter, family [Rhodospirillaceae bacterium]